MSYVQENDSTQNAHIKHSNDSRQKPTWKNTETIRHMRDRQLSLFYEILNKFVIVCQRKHLRLIIENPLSTSGMHYLTHFWYF